MNTTEKYPFSIILHSIFFSVFFSHHPNIWDFFSYIRKMFHGLLVLQSESAFWQYGASVGGQYLCSTSHMPEAPRPIAAVWLMHGNVCTAFGKSWAMMRPFSPPLLLPLIRVSVVQRMASLMDCWDEDMGRVRHSMKVLHKCWFRKGC